MFALVCSFQLGQKISKEINPQSTKPSDVKVMKTLVPLVEKGTDLLKKYNESGNATIDYINITDSLGELGRQWGMSNRGASPPLSRKNKKIDGEEGESIATTDMHPTPGGLLALHYV